MASSCNSLFLRFHAGEKKVHGINFILSLFLGEKIEFFKMGLSLTNVNDCYQHQKHWHTEILEKIPPHLEWRISNHPRSEETSVCSHLRTFPQSMGDGDRMMKIVAATCCCHWCQCTHSEEILCSKLYQRDNIFRINSINTLFSKNVFMECLPRNTARSYKTHMACLQVSAHSTLELLILMFLQYLLQFS